MTAFPASRRRAIGLDCRGVWIVAALWTLAIAPPTEAEEPVGPGPGLEFDSAALEFFEREVRPILAERCYACHSAQAKPPKGGLRLDSRRGVLRGGDTGPAIVIGNPRDSLLIDAINHGEIYQMPPKTKLPADEIVALTKWVELGAPWPAEQGLQLAESDTFDLQQRRAAHWCWQPVRQPELPQVQSPDWPQTELDFFILAKLEARGLAPAAAADRRTLIRRLSFDLIGLPPTAQEVASFVADTSAQAWEHAVDRLLKSPHYGERWARHWMDLVRYAETFGHEFDYPLPHAAEYRDYLIRAFNADVPYDQFVCEHIAGDLLQPPRRHPSEGFNESVIGTGFWWLGEATHAPVDVKGDEAGRIDNQLDVLSKTFQGLTVACARCHDHKFDAISTKDYYALAGILQSSRRDHALLDPGGRIQKLAQRLGELNHAAGQQLKQAVRDSDTSAEFFARQLWAAQLSPAEQTAPAGMAEPPREEAPGLARWRAALRQDELREIDHPLHAWTLATERAAQGESPSGFRAELAARAKQAREHNAALPQLTSFDAYDNWFLSGHAFGAEPTAAGQWNPQAGAPSCLPAGWAHSGLCGDKLQGSLRSPTFTLTHKNIYYRLAGQNAKVRLIVDGYFMDEFNKLLFHGFSFDVNTGGKVIWQRQAQDVERYLGHRAYIEIVDSGDGYVAVDEIRFSDGPPPLAEPSRLAQRALAEPEVGSLQRLADRYGQLLSDAVAAWLCDQADHEQAVLVNWLWTSQLLELPPEQRDAWQQLLQQRQAALAQLPAPKPVLAMTEGTPEDEFLFVRGDHRIPGDAVPRAYLESLADQPEPVYQGSGRLELARRITDPGNPLTARVIVNRVWHHLFGRGIVASVDNFGVLGERPTHPQLLDYLAVRFMREGWSIKQLIRTIVLSSTYRMASTPAARASELDPENLLLHRMRVRRLQGEVIRDSMLAVSGQLDRKMFGPSVPIYITPFMQGRGRPKRNGPLDGQGRRSIYLEVRRNFLSPMMLAYDTPLPFSTMGRRNTSNVPGQALILMNDPFVVEQAQHWARRLVQRPASREERIRDLYLAAFAREPTRHELGQAVTFMAEQARALGVPPAQREDAIQVWADLAHVLFNVKEFVFVN